MGPYCNFCGSRCFVHVPNHTPPEFLAMYREWAAKHNRVPPDILATCAAGQREEKEKIGCCYDDIKKAIAEGSGRIRLQHMPSLDHQVLGLADQHDNQYELLVYQSQESPTKSYSIRRLLSGGGTQPIPVRGRYTWGNGLEVEGAIKEAEEALTNPAAHV